MASFKESCHGADHALRSFAVTGSPAKLYANNDSSEALLQVFHIRCQTEGSPAISEATVITKWSSRTKPSCLCAESHYNVSQHTVVHVKTSLPEDLSRVDSKSIPC